MKTKSIIFLGILLLFCVNILGQSADPLRIKFAKGKTSTIISEKLSDGEEMDFVFGAKAGQKITLKLSSSPKGKLFDFRFIGEDSNLQTKEESYTDYSFVAPETCDYLITVRKQPFGKVKSATFYLNLAIK